MKLISDREYSELLKPNKDLEETKLSLAKATEYADALKNRIKDLEEQVKELKQAERKIKAEFELAEKKAIVALEHQRNTDLMNLEKDYNKKLTAFKERQTEEFTKKVQSLVEEQYSKLSNSMTKLHEEGNANSKFVQDMNKEMLKAIATSRPQLTEK